MKTITITVISSFLLVLTGCQKCYNCSNSCCKRVSTNEILCSDQFASFQDYHHVLDSLGADIYCGPNTLATYYKKACKGSDVEYYQSMRGVSCSPISK